MDRTTVNSITLVIEATRFGVSVLGRLFAVVYNRNLDRAIPSLVQEKDGSPA